jgi:hypothetical protein
VHGGQAHQEPGAAEGRVVDLRFPGDMVTFVARAPRLLSVTSA